MSDDAAGPQIPKPARHLDHFIGGALRLVCWPFQAMIQAVLQILTNLACLCDIVLHPLLLFVLVCTPVLTYMLPLGNMAAHTFGTPLPRFLPRGNSPEPLTEYPLPTQESHRAISLSTFLSSTPRLFASSTANDLIQSLQCSSIRTKESIEIVFLEATHLAAAAANYAQNVQAYVYIDGEGVVSIGFEKQALRPLAWLESDPRQSARRAEALLIKLQGLEVRLAMSRQALQEVLVRLREESLRLSHSPLWQIAAVLEFTERAARKQDLALIVRMAAYIEELLLKSTAIEAALPYAETQIEDIRQNGAI